VNEGDGYPGRVFGSAVPAGGGFPARTPAYPAPVSGGTPQQTATPVSGASFNGPAPTGPGPTEPARGAAVVPASTDDAEVKAVRRPGHLGALSIGQIIIAEVTVLVAGAAATRGLIPGLIAGAVAVALIAIFFARRHHRWWLEDRLVAWQYRRRRAAALDTGAGPILAALRAVAPGLSVRDVSAPDGARVGVARDEAGWFSVVALTPTAPVHQEAAPIPLDALVGVIVATEQPGVVLQLVTHTVPAPSLDLHPASPAGSSYRQLAHALSPVAVPAHRESSVSVRVDARGLAEALLDHNADPEAAAALVASLGRKVATSLRRLGIACRVLDTDDLIAALARSCDVESGAIGDASQVREEWTQWHSARLTHRTFWLKTWPSSATTIGALFDWAAATPAAQTSVALILDASGDDDVAVRALIRLAARSDDDITALENTLLAGVKRVGGELQPLDGEQGPGAYATAPTGGGAG
jgi:type VII secretion protein EccE